MKKDQVFVPPQTEKAATVAMLRHGGTHLIRPIIDAMGFEIVEPGYFAAPMNQAFGRVILFPRDPRNRMVATCRFKLTHSKATRMPLVVRGNDKDTMLSILLASEPFVPEMLKWARIWCNWRPALRVTFEELTESEPSAIKAVGKIAKYLGEEPDKDHDAALVKGFLFRSKTYTGSLSRWQDWFGPQSWEIWKRDGGDELMNLMGYAE